MSEPTSGLDHVPSSTALPVYVVVNTSASLGSHVGDIQQSLKRMLDDLDNDPLVAATVHLSLVTFAEVAHELVPLTPVEDIRALPIITVGGYTRYASAFKLVRALISRDVERLRTAGQKVLRPLMFFIAGAGDTASDSWRDALDELRSPTFVARPTIIALGFGSPDPDVLSEIGASGGAFSHTQSEPLGEAIGSVFEELTRMLVSTTTSSISPAAGRSTELRIPDHWIDIRSITGQD
jgi:uncharacterized protein YegL